VKKIVSSEGGEGTAKETYPTMPIDLPMFHVQGEIGEGYLSAISTFLVSK